ncbi:ABC transporter permease [Lacticaseibacillus kribbianus]|uniref:ABC transporter permease n=1 Tax=Lacticaseibacillus kribbianus TaxID=2926292 RepID=UPI001CD37A95|nr:ABC transporter permease [Lacticaseibacillus kribbianus]
MGELWRSRLRRHQKTQFKYLQFVFNDHFVLVLVILAGALLYAYSTWIKTLTVTWWLRLLLGLILAGLLSLGGLASLAQAADSTFLLPQTGAFAKLLLRARRYSLLLPLVVLALAALACAPMLQVLGIAPLAGALTLGVALVAFKDCDLWLQLLRFYPAFLPRWATRALLLLVAFAALTLGLFLHPVVAAAVALVLDLGLRWQLGDHFAPAGLDWLGLIAFEERRQGRLYRFYNLFTDVPGLGGGVRRRRYLDFLAHLVSQNHAHAWDFLYVRGFLRRTEFSGLYLRLLVIGAVVLTFAKPLWLVALLAALFVYLVGFQLLPLALASDDIVFTHLYPLPAAQRNRAFGRLVLVLLVLLALLLSVGLVVTGRFLAAGVAVGAGLVLACGFALWYLPMRLGRQARG